MKRRTFTKLVVVSLAVVAVTMQPARAESPACQPSDPFCYQTSAETHIDALKDVVEPRIAVPIWLGASN